MVLGPLLSAAGSGLLQRTFLLENSTFNLIPRVLCVFDAVVEESPTFSSQVTEYPVEDGTEITDHIQLKNPTLKLTGTVSNTPIDLSVAVANIAAGGIAAITSSQFRKNFLNAGLQQAAGVGGAKLLGAAASLKTAATGATDSIARGLLLDAWERKARFDVVTKRQRYDSMVIESMTFPRDSGTGFQLMFELNLKTIRVVKPLKVNIASVSEDVVTSASSDTNLGSQTAKGVSAGAETNFNKSWIRQIAKAVRS